MNCCCNFYANSNLKSELRSQLLTLMILSSFEFLPEFLCIWIYFVAESLVVLFSYTAFSLENTIPIELESRFSFNMNYFENKAHTWNGMNFERFLRGFPCSPKSSPVISKRVVDFSLLKSGDSKGVLNLIINSRKIRFSNGI